MTGLLCRPAEALAGSALVDDQDLQPGSPIDGRPLTSDPGFRRNSSKTP